MTDRLPDRMRWCLRVFTRTASFVIRQVLPKGFYRRAQSHWKIIRTNRYLTKLLGSEFSRSRRLLEIDITYACNLNCFNCNRSCEQAPTGQHMSLRQIQSSVDEWMRERKTWDRIRILGGEPTTHKQFCEIIELLRSYRRDCSPETVIEVTTNGHGERVNDAIRRIPPDVNVNNTAKQSEVQPGF